MCPSYECIYFSRTATKKHTKFNQVTAMIDIDLTVKTIKTVT